MFLQETELLVAGFPCIDVSRAGLRKGFQGQVRNPNLESCLESFKVVNYFDPLSQIVHRRAVEL